MRRWRFLLAGAVLPVILCGALWLVVPLGSQAASQDRLADIQSKIRTTQGKIGFRKGKERVLTSDIARYSARINRLQGNISTLQRKQDRIQADLDARRAELIRTQDRLRDERARLARLRARLAEGRKVLAKRLREIYEADRPDLVTVVLNSDGFADLIERGEFLSRIQEQDNRIVSVVRAAKKDATETAARLDELEQRQQRLTALVLQRRDEVSEVRMALVGQRYANEQAKGEKQAVLRSMREERHSLETHLDELRKESQKVQAQLASAASGIPAGPVKGGSGAMIWPINGTLTSPFCEARSWESCHPGIDIAAPTGTPIRAADGGRVAIAGWVGGYGNYTCIQHSSSLSSCYGHQSAIHVRVGQSVSKGSIIGLVGSTGHSTGPHLHFEVRINGAVTNPMNYL